MNEGIMNEKARPRPALRSLGAVLAGIMADVILTVGTDSILHATGVYPPWGQPLTDADALMLLATIYRLVYGIAGSYITARLAPNRPVRHALVCGVVGLVICIAGAVATWNGGPAFGPHWYPLTLIATAVPCAWLGGQLRVMQLGKGPRR
jgi:peptidoglycan/LPS O-acetylase OafA/YrhL